MENIRWDYLINSVEVHIGGSIVDSHYYCECGAEVSECDGKCYDCTKKHNLKLFNEKMKFPNDINGIIFEYYYDAYRNMFDLCNAWNNKK